MLARSAGNPKNIEEILSQWIKERAIDVRDGRIFILSDNLASVCVVVCGDGLSLQAGSPEKTVQHFINVIDCLQARHSHLVKVCVR